MGNRSYAHVFLAFFPPYNGILTMLALTSLVSGGRLLAPLARASGFSEGDCHARQGGTQQCLRQGRGRDVRFSGFLGDFIGIDLKPTGMRI
jgi:hypothetical protein